MTYMETSQLLYGPESRARFRGSSHICNEPGSRGSPQHDIVGGRLHDNPRNGTNPGGRRDPIANTIQAMLVM